MNEPRPWPLPEPLPHPVVDHHCHLDMSRGDEPLPDVAATLADAAAVGVDRVVHIGCDVERARRAITLAEQHPAVVVAVGLLGVLTAAGDENKSPEKIEELRAFGRSL